MIFLNTKPMFPRLNQESPSKWNFWGMTNIWFVLLIYLDRKTFFGKIKIRKAILKQKQFCFQHLFSQQTSISQKFSAKNSDFRHRSRAARRPKLLLPKSRIRKWSRSRKSSSSSRRKSWSSRHKSEFFLSLKMICIKCR